MCAVESWMYLENCQGLEEFVISYSLDRDAFNSLFPYLGRKIPVVLIGQPKNLSLVLNK